MIRGNWIRIGSFEGYRGNLHVASLAASLMFLFATSSGLALGLSFSAPVSYRAGAGPMMVLSSDFNHDGNPDLAVANSGNTVSILLGNGDGTFQVAVPYTVPETPVFLAVADFNGDGKPDLAVGTSDSAVILLGKGDGTFELPVSYQALISVKYLSTADFNDDGKPDLLAAAADGAISILLGNGDGTFQPAAVTTTTGTARSVAIGDFNGDGYADIATGNTGNGVPGPGFGNLIVLLGNGDGTFQQQMTIALSFQPTYLVASDLNGDGKSDLAVVAREPYFGGGIRVLWGNGDGSFKSWSGTMGFFDEQVAVADLDGDGELDLVGLEAFDPQNFPIEIQLMLSHGSGTFQGAQGKSCMQSSGCIQLSSVPNWLAISDVNKDGAPDLIVTNPKEGTVSVLLNSVQSGPDFSLSSFSLTPGIIAPGEGASGTLSLNWTGGLNGTVSFTCSVQPAPSNAPTCAVRPYASGASVTVSTTAPTAAALPGGAIWLCGLCPLIGVLRKNRSLKSRTRNRMAVVCVCGFLVSAFPLLTSCSGTSTQHRMLGGTPAGTYTITITGTSGSLQHSISGSVTVQ